MLARKILGFELEKYLVQILKFNVQLVHETLGISGNLQTVEGWLPIGQTGFQPSCGGTGSWKDIGGGEVMRYLNFFFGSVGPH